MANQFLLDNVLLFIPLRMGNIYLGVMEAIFYLASCIRLITLFTRGSHFFPDYIYIISIPLSLMHTIFCLVFVVGILMRNRNMLMPWLLSHILMTTLVALDFILGRSHDAISLTIKWIIFQSYIWLCGYSLYKKTFLSMTGSYRNRVEHQKPSGFEKVLFCIPLRIGNILLGFAGTIFYFMLTIYFGMKTTSAHHFRKTFILILMLIVSSFQTIVCALFVAGIIKNKHRLLLPWLFSQILVSVIVSVYFAGSHFYDTSSFVIELFFVQLYIWCCGFSFYDRLHTTIHPTIKSSITPTTESGTSIRNLKLRINQAFDQLPQLPVLKNVLFIVPLRIGNIAIGLTSAIFYLVITICSLAKCIHYLKNYNYIPSKIYYIPLISVSLAHSIMSVIFVAGILTKKQRLIFFWLISQILTTIATAFIYSLYNHQHFNCFSLVINWILIHVYIWFCGYSIYNRMPTRGNEYNNIPSTEMDTCTEKYQNVDFVPEIPILKKILFLIPLRSGNILLGLIGTILCLVLGILLIIKATHSARHFSSKLYYGIMISLLLVHSILCARFIVGILKKKQHMLFHWLLSQIILTVGTVILQSIYYSHDLDISQAIYWIVIQTYIWLCGYSIYQYTPTCGTDYVTITSSKENEDFSAHPEVPILESVLFCIPLRVGNIILGLIGTILYLALGILQIIKATHRARYFLSIFYYGIMISLLLVHSILCARFIVGILKKKQHMLFPWLFSQIILTVGTVILHAIYYSHDLDIPQVIFWIVIQAYIWLCGYSIYQNTPTRGTDYATITASKENEDFPAHPEAPILESVLFFIPLRIGNIILGSVAAFFYFVISLCLILQSTTDAIKFADKFYFISLICASLIHSVHCVIFVGGILKKRQLLLLPWLCSHFLTTVIAVFILHRLRDTANITICFIALQCYIWICGYSVYQLTPTQGADTSFLSLTECIINEDFDSLTVVPVLENILICIPLKIGNICLGLTQALIYFVLGIFFINGYAWHGRHLSEKFYYLPMATVLLIHAILCAFFVIGIIKKKQQMLLPWLLSQIAIMFVPVALQYQVYNSPDFISFDINWIVLQGYIWLCGYSSFQRRRSADYDFVPSSEDEKFSGLFIPNYQDLDYADQYKQKIKVCDTY